MKKLVYTLLLFIIILTACGSASQPTYGPEITIHKPST